jgi:hypothetical protein
VGRHAASDGASMHPLVAAALARRSTDAARAHRRAGQQPGREGGLGWPGPSPDGGGLGWPGEDLAPGSGAGDTGPEEGAATEEPALPAGRRWRRFFGLDPAA